MPDFRPYTRRPQNNKPESGPNDDTDAFRNEQNTGNDRAGAEQNPDTRPGRWSARPGAEQEPRSERFNRFFAPKESENTLERGGNPENEGQGDKVPYKRRAPYQNRSTDGRNERRPYSTRPSESRSYEGGTADRPNSRYDEGRSEKKEYAPRPYEQRSTDRNGFGNSNYKNKYQSGNRSEQGDERSITNTGEANEPKDLVFGIRAVEEVLKSGRQIDRLLVQNNEHSPALKALVKQAEEAGVALQRVPPDRLDRVTRKNHQGVICFISPVHFAELTTVIAGIYERGEVPLILILDRITDVRNFGAIARSAECAGVHAIVVPAKGSAQIGGDAMKTSAGALNFLPVCRENNLEKTIQLLQDSGICVAACTEKAEATLYQTDLNLPLAIIVGSEEDGISMPLIRKADRLMGIPIVGKISSLNVSVASAVAVYEAFRQRSGAVVGV